MKSNNYSDTGTRYEVVYADEHIGNELDGDRLAGWYWIRTYPDGTPNGMDGVGPFDTELEACDNANECA